MSSSCDLHAGDSMPSLASLETDDGAKTDDMSAVPDSEFETDIVSDEEVMASVLLQKADGRVKDGDEPAGDSPASPTQQLQDQEAAAVTKQTVHSMEAAVQTEACFFPPKIVYIVLPAKTDLTSFGKATATSGGLHTPSDAGVSSEPNASRSASVGGPQIQHTGMVTRNRGKQSRKKPYSLRNSAKKSRGTFRKGEEMGKKISVPTKFSCESLLKNKHVSLMAHRGQSLLKNSPSNLKASRIIRDVHKDPELMESTSVDKESLSLTSPERTDLRIKVLVTSDGNIAVGSSLLQDSKQGVQESSRLPVDGENRADLNGSIIAGRDNGTYARIEGTEDTAFPHKDSPSSGQKSSTVSTGQEKRQVATADGCASNTADACSGGGTGVACSVPAPTSSLSQPRPYACQVCSATFTMSGYLSRHMMEHDDWRRRYPCKDCSATFIYPYQLKEHRLRQHRQQKPYACTKCQASYWGRSGLGYHMRVHTGEKPFICKVCGDAFMGSGQLTDHMLKHSDQKPHVCKECGSSYKRAYDLKKHMRKHTGFRPYACKECGARFTLSAGLNEHMKTHTGEKPFLCAECGHAFRRLSVLQRHKSKHTGEKPYVCTECGTAFRQAHVLKQHYTRRHTNHRPFLCSECGSSFAASIDLKIHSRVHTGERPFQCSECGASFKQYTQMKDHVLRHSDSRPHSCQECGFAFKVPSDLRKHMRAHRRLKHHICITCSAAFIRHAELLAHIKTHKD